jgi:hypothetical protein
MTDHCEKTLLPDMVSRIADEINMHHAIDAIDISKSSIQKEEFFEEKVRHVYYVSATPDAQREKEHLHKILERKNRSFLTQLDPDISNNRCMTVICLWDHLYKEDQKCHVEFNNLFTMSQKHPDQLRIVAVLLQSDIEISDQFPKSVLCLPGFDRVSRELAILKIVQDE